MMRVKFLPLLFLLAINLSYCRQSSAGGYYFNHFVKTITLNKNDDYLCVRFTPGSASQRQDEVINNVFKQVIDETKEMTETYQDGTKSRVIMIKVKKNTPQALLSQARESLLKYNEVEHSGLCFAGNDKVLHFVTDEVIVKFKRGLNQFEIQNLSKLFKTQIIQKVDYFDNVYLFSIDSRGEAGKDDAFDVSNKYSLTQFVEFAQPNFIRIGMLATPNDSLLSQMWHIKNTGNNLPHKIQITPGCDLNADSAWNITIGNIKVLLAILDTGVDTTHPDLFPNFCERSLWYDAYEEDQQPQDQHSHGTAITGIAGAVGNNIMGTVGVAYGCKMMPVRVFGPQGQTTDLILAKGLNWAWIHGACVLSNSWGGGVETPIITHAILNAKNFGRGGKGAVVLAATGNGDTNVIIYPASMPEVIAVGGLSPCNQRKSKTSCDNFNGQQNWGACFGDNMSIVAPTPFIGTTLLGGGWCICANGTSSSCPQAAAIAALILTKNINLSADSVRMIIERSAQKVGNYSYSILKPNGLWNYEMGYGRIDGKRALDMTPAGTNFIYDQSPPVINLNAPRSISYSSPVSFTSNITDNETVASGNNSPRLYFYSSENPVTQFVTGQQLPNNNYSFTFPQLPYKTWIRYYAAAQDTSSNGNITTYPFGGTGVNPPGTNPPQKLLFFQNTEYNEELFVSTNVPIIISSQRETTIVSTQNIPIDKTILEIRSMINIDHSYLSDISVSLISPAGTEIVLTSGTGGDGDNYRNTNFSDYAQFPITDTNFMPPYTGTFKPVEKLWFLNGENSLGIWKLKVVDNVGADGGTLLGWSTTVRYSKPENPQLVPARFSLLGNYPNPFNPSTRIYFDVAYRANIKIIVYDIVGREVFALLNGIREPKFSDYVDFNSSSSSINGGRGLSSGIYFYLLIVNDNFIESRKMILLK